MANPWNITEAEYEEARALSSNANVNEEDAAEYWQLVRFYRNQIFNRDQAERAVRRIRHAGED